MSYFGSHPLDLGSLLTCSTTDFVASLSLLSRTQLELIITVFWSFHCTYGRPSKGAHKPKWIFLMPTDQVRGSETSTNTRIFIHSHSNTRSTSLLGSEHPPRLVYYYRPVGHLVQEPTQSLIPHPSQYLCRWKNKLRLFPADRASFEVYGVDRCVMWMAIQLGFSHWGSGALNRMGLVWFKDWSVNSHFRNMAPWFLSMTKHLRNLVSLPFSFPACDFLRAKGLLKADAIADQILSFWDNWALKTLSCGWLPHDSVWTLYVHSNSHYLSEAL